MDMYLSAFKENNIDHPMYIPLLDGKSLSKDVGIKNSLHRKLILRKVEEFMSDTARVCSFRFFNPYVPVFFQTV